MKLVKKKPTLCKIDDTKRSSSFTDLRQVMDYNREFTMFYSGVEYEVYFDHCYEMGVRDFLMSYQYARGKGIGSLKKHNDISLFIDSGAFTYMQDPKYLDFTEEMWEQQIEEYLSWAKKHKDAIFAIADLDLQQLVGTDKVNTWRRKYFEPFMLETGIPVCFVWHDADGEEAWEKMCQRYPYVSISMVSDEGAFDLNEVRSKLRIAEKYNTLVQGMGSTRTSVLPQLPFYTVDSTSWKVGMRYGLLSVWDGKKVKQFKRDEWESKAIPIMNTYKDVQFDLVKLQEDDVEETIHANVYAYLRAEEFIRERLRSLTYWKKAKTVQTDINNLPSDFFPTVKWFEDGCVNAREYAVKMNINPELPTADLNALIYDVTALMNWDNPTYEKIFGNYTDNSGSLINELHDFYINRIVPDQDTKIEDLRNFFGDCISGKNDKLLQLGTNFDRMVKERDSYIEDNEEELVDITPQEIQVKLYGLLPTPVDAVNSEAPELDDLDREIFKKADIIPTFDEKGKFLKGQVSVRKPKKMYSKKYPKFACDTCYAAAKCPEFKAGYVCAYNKMFNRYDTRDMADIIQAMQGMVEHNLTRMQRAMVMEVLNGTIDGQVTSFIDQNMRLMSNLKQMYELGSSEVLRQTHIVRADGTTESTTQVTNPQSGGILEKLFSGMGTSDAKEKVMEEVEVEVIKPETKKKNSRYDNIEDDM